jgi:hypothetical protein
MANVVVVEGGTLEVSTNMKRVLVTGREVPMEAGELSSVTNTASKPASAAGEGIAALAASRSIG